MDLERVALEAVKVKIQEIFDSISVSTVMEGKDIIIRVSLPEKIMNVTKATPLYDGAGTPNLGHATVGLDQDAQAAAKDILG